MERDSYNENFERFLRFNANNFRMKASEKVWKNVSKEMNKRRRRIGFALGAFLLLITTAGYYFVTHSIKQLPVSNSIAIVQKQDQPISTERSVSSEQNNVISEQQPVIVNTRLTTEQEQQKSTRLPNEIILAATQNQVEESSGIAQNNFISPVVDSYEPVRENNSPASISNTLPIATRTILSQVPTIESVANIYKAKSKKFTLQFNFSPTVSYRKLGENKSYTRSISMFNAPTSYVPLYSVNDAVTQKPSMGLEMGLTGKYAISKGLKLTAGFQFNVSRYDIKAFNAPYTLATYRFNDGGTVDSVTVPTNISNVAGYETNWLQNMYVQFSMPVGVELKLAGDNNTQFGIAAAVQPTYLLGGRSYLLTPDYQSYAEMAWLTRRWNVNTSLNTFVSYSTGRMRWQVGPQVRYQLLSSFINKYPVKENLFDFGLKVGISLNK